MVSTLLVGFSLGQEWLNPMRKHSVYFLGFPCLDRDVDFFFSVIQDIHLFKQRGSFSDPFSASAITCFTSKTSRVVLQVPSVM